MAKRKDALVVMAVALEKHGWDVRDIRWRCTGCGVQCFVPRKACFSCGSKVRRIWYDKKGSWRGELTDALEAYAAAGGTLEGL